MPWYWLALKSPKLKPNSTIFPKGVFLLKIVLNGLKIIILGTLREASSVRGILTIQSQCYAQRKGWSKGTGNEEEEENTME